MGFVDLIRGRERRDPTAATAPPMASMWSINGPGLATSTVDNDDLTVRKRWLANTYVDSAIRAIATDLARLKFRAGPDPDRPADWNPSAPLAWLLGPRPGGPNRHTSVYRLWHWTVASRVGLGKWAWELELLDGTAVGVWPLAAQYLTPKRTKGGSEWFSGYEYHVSQGPPRQLSPDRVVFDWVPHPQDFRKPYSPLDAAALDIDVMVAQDRYDLAFIYNDSKPATVVVHEEFADTDERDAWRAKFDGRHRGPDNAGRTAFMETTPGMTGVQDALQVITVGLSQKDAETLKRYEAKVRSALVAIGVPMSRLNDSSKRTFSNAGNEIRTYWQNTIAPLTSEIADAVNMQLAPHVGGGNDVGWFDLTEVEELRPTPLLAFPTLTEAVKAGVVDEDEAREMMGLAPRPEAPVEEPPVEEPEPVEAAAPPVEQRTPLSLNPPAPPDRAAIRDTRRAVFAITSDALEQAFTRTIDDLLTRQRDAVLGRLTGARSAGRRARDAGELRADAVFDSDWWRARTAQDTYGLYVQIVAAAGAEFATQFAVDFDLAAPHVESFIQARANQLAGQITDTTYRAIQSQLAEGVVAGEGIPELAKRIENLFDQTYAKRAEAVARTEVVSAYNGGSRTVALGYGPEVVAGMEWVATFDDRTRDPHRNADGQTAPITGEFLVGGERLAYPGDPNGSPSNTVRCRCTLAHLTPEEYADATGLRSVPLAELEARITEVALGRAGWDDVLREVPA